MQTEKEAFICCQCNKKNYYTDNMGTKHRNHCRFCLWSKHVDLDQSGDRASQCNACMKPVGLTFKNEGVDKYGKARQGELMIIHECTGCGCISINRIASDDSADTLTRLFHVSQQMEKEKKELLENTGIKLIPLEKEKAVLIQLFGKNYDKH